MKRKITLFAAILCLLSMAVTLGGCQIFDKIFGNEEEENRIATIEEQMAAIEKSIGDLQLTDTQLKACIDALTAEQEQLRADNESLTARIDANEAAIAALETQKKALGDRVTATENDIDSLENNVKELDERIEALENDGTAAEVKAALETLKKQAEEEIASLKTQMATAENNIKAMQEAEQKLDKRVNVLENDKESYEAFKTQTKNSIEDLNKYVSDFAKEITAINSRISNIDGNIIKINDDLTNIDTIIGDVKNDLESYRNTTNNKISSLNTRITTNRTDIDILKAQIIGLETNSTNLNQSVSDNTALINNISGNITDLQTAQNGLEERINTLYRTQNSLATQDWVNTTFATLEQQQATQAALDEVTLALAAVNSDLDIQDSTSKLAVAIAASETRLRTWINQAFYDKDCINAKITALEQADTSLNTSINDLRRSLDQAMTDLTGAYKGAIQTAISDQGLINDELQGKIDDAKTKYDAAISSINTQIAVINATLADHDDKIADILARLEALEKENEALKKNNEELQHQVDCMSNKHTVENDKVTYQWNADFTVCTATYNCKYCGESARVKDQESAGIDYGRPQLQGKSTDCYKLTATFDRVANFQDAPANCTIDITDFEKLSYTQAYNAVKMMLAEGSTITGTFVTVKNPQNNETTNHFASVDDAINNEFNKDFGVTLFITGTESIPEEAFICNSKLTGVVLGSDVKSIGNRAFDQCGNLKQVDLPTSLETIGECAFADCTMLTSFTFPDNAADGIEISIGNEAFARTGLTSIRIPSNVTSIGSNIFSSCTALEKVTLAMETVPMYLLGACDSLKTVTLESTVKTISDLAFHNITSLDTIKMSSVETIGGGAFNGCTALRSVDCGNKLTTIGSNAFENCQELKSIDLGDSLTTIGNYAFTGCTALGNVYIPGSVTSVGQCAFQNCTSLQRIEFGAGFTKLSGAAIFLNNCNALNTITFNSILTEIGSEAFQGITTENINLFLVAGQKTMAYEYNSENTEESGYIPTTTDISAGVGVEFCRKTFNAVILTGTIDAKNMTAEQLGTAVKSAVDKGATIFDVTLPSTASEEHFRALSNALSAAPDGSITLTVRGATTIPYDAFAKQTKGTNNAWVCEDNKAIGGIIIGKEISSIYTLAFEYLPKLGGIQVVEDNATFKSSEDGELYTKDGKTLLAYPAGNQNKHFELPDGVEVIDMYAFNECNNLTSVSLANNVNDITINENAFYCCKSLKEVFLGYQVDSVPEYAFFDCTALESVIMMLYKTSINENSFGTDINKNITLTIQGDPEDLNFVDLIDTDGKTYRNVTFKNIIITDYIDARRGSTATTLLLKANFGESYENIEDNITLMVRLPYTEGDENIAMASLNALRTYFNGYTGDCTVDLIIIGTSYIPWQSFETTVGMFEGCEWLSGVTLGETVWLISHNTFKDCVNLTTVDLGGVEEIGASAFRGCTSLANVDLGRVERIYEEAFYGCTALKSITIPSTVTTIRDAAFSGSGLTSVTIPGTVVDVGSGPFAYCTSLESVEFGDGFTAIPAAFFLGCTKLSTVTIPKSVTLIGAESFKDTAITDIHYAGTEDDWSRITIQEGWAANSSGTTATYTVHFSSGDHKEYTR